MKKKMKTSWSIFTVTAIALTMLASCTPKDETGDNNKGSLKVLLTDSPFPADEVRAVNVTVDRVSIKQPDDLTTEETDESGFLVLSEETNTYNLLDLQNGTVATLANIESIGPGTYTEIRLHIVSAEIVLIDGSVFDLKIPSGSSSGLKIKIDGGLEVRSGNLSTLILDFDVSRSFVMKGRNPHTGVINGFNFKPVIRAVAEDISGSMEGTVTNADKTVALPNAAIRIISSDMQDTLTALTNEAGYYAVIGLLPDSYKVIASKSEFVSDTVFAAGVEKYNIATVDFALDAVPVVTPAP